MGRLHQDFALSPGRVLTLQRGRKEPRLVLCTVSRRDVNLGLTLVLTREAIDKLEAQVDPNEIDELDA